MCARVRVCLCAYVDVNVCICALNAFTDFTSNEIALPFHSTANKQHLILKKYRQRRRARKGERDEKKVSKRKKVK